MPVYKEETPSKYRLLQSEHSESGGEEAVSSDALGIEDIYILIGMYFRLDDCKLVCSTEFWSIIRNKLNAL